MGEISCNDRLDKMAPYSSTVHCSPALKDQKVFLKKE